MTHPMLDVARWEFRRYLKIKQQIVGMMITFFTGAAVIGVMRMSERDVGTTRTVAVIHSDTMPLTLLPAWKLAFRKAPPKDERTLRSAVANDEIAGLLIIRGRTESELVVRKQGEWISEVSAAVAAARQTTLMEQAGVHPEQLARILAPTRMDVTIVRKGGGITGSKQNRVALMVVLAFMVMCVFIGMSYIFSSITGEKQNRVTEQIISAIPAQSWIDGKIIGLIGVSVVSVVNTAIASGALVFVMLKVKGVSLPPFSGDLGMIALVAVFGLLGLSFWFAFLAAIAAAIDDPQNSTRGSLLFIPLLATVLAFFVTKNPDGGFARVLSLLPPTAPSAMPARMILGAASPLEIILSLVLLLAGVWVLRIAAGRIFRIAMLMYGKEPTWAEMKRWAFAR